MKTYRWATLGCGVIANELAQAMQKDGRTLYGVANRTYENAVAFAKKYEVEKVYKNIQDLFEDDDVDIVYISTPHNTHIQYLREALKHGKHVLCEKSITLNAKELEEAKQLAEEGAPNGTYVIAERQDAGKGRRGRGFDSPAGQGIWMTLVLKPEIDPNHASMITLVTALAVSKAITDMTGRPAGIKWPNDIIMSGKKVCGILTEMSAQFDYVNHIVVGIGVNVQNKSFPKDIESVATSLFIETKEHYHRAELVERIWEAFEHYYEIFLQTEDLSGLVNEYNSHLVNMHQQVKVLDPKNRLRVKPWESRQKEN